MRIALVSCVKSKRPTFSAARDLYTSPLFRAMRNYAERKADAWFILSAELGLVEPSVPLAPYERTLNRMPRRDRQPWTEMVRVQLLEALPGGAEIVFLAGKNYREGLIPFLEQRGFAVSVPMKGLALGKQLQFLKRENEKLQ